MVPPLFFVHIHFLQQIFIEYQVSPGVHAHPCINWRQGNEQNRQGSCEWETMMCVIMGYKRPAEETNLTQIPLRMRLILISEFK